MTDWEFFAWAGITVVVAIVTHTDGRLSGRIQGMREVLDVLNVPEVPESLNKTKP